MLEGGYNSERYSKPEESLIKQATISLENILRANRDLEHYTSNSQRQAALLAIQNAGEFFNLHPILIRKLDTLRSMDDDYVNMLIIQPDSDISHPMVIVADEDDFTVFFPTTSCVMEAIKALRMDRANTITQSNYKKNKLFSLAIDRLSKSFSGVITYSESKLDPQDFIALGVSGIFYNEPLLIPLSRLTTQTP